MAVLLFVLISIWLLAGVVLVGLCRSAAAGDASLRDGLERWNVAHWGDLER